LFFIHRVSRARAHTLLELIAPEASTDGSDRDLALSDAIQSQAPLSGFFGPQSYLKLVQSFAKAFAISPHGSLS
jgi:hypothetical protein